MDRLAHLPFPDLNGTLPNTPFSEKRVTEIHPDEFGDYTLIQKQGSTHNVVVLNFKELNLIYRAACKHEMEK